MGLGLSGGDTVRVLWSVLWISLCDDLIGNGVEMYQLVKVILHYTKYDWFSAQQY